MHDPDALFRCAALDCTLRLRVCVARQVVTARAMRGDLGARSSRRKRGVSPEFVACHDCPRGRAIRAALGDEVARHVRVGGRPDVAEQAPKLLHWLRFVAREAE